MISRRNGYLVIFILLVFCVSAYIWSLPSVGIFNVQKKNKAGHSTDSHSHQNLSPVPATKPHPKLSVKLVRKKQKNVLLLHTKNFRFKAATSKDSTSITESPMRGHAHLLVNGESIAMFYTDRYVLPDFMKGTYTITVTLNQAGSHAPISVNGSVVADTVELEVNQRQE
jgi:hypothetical protein